MRLSIKRTTIVEIISALFILLFLYTALSKSLQIGSTVAVLKKTPTFSNYANEIAWGVVFFEYITGALLFLRQSRIIGLYTSLFLMIGFTIYISYMMAFVPDLPCSCGGVISKMTWTQHLLFNIFFTLLALTGIFLERKRIKPRHPELEGTSVVFT
jgi:putative oxidoreductase